MSNQAFEALGAGQLAVLDQEPKVTVEWRRNDGPHLLALSATRWLVGSGPQELPESVAKQAEAWDAEIGLWEASRPIWDELKGLSKAEAQSRFGEFAREYLDQEPKVPFVWPYSDTEAVKVYATEWSLVPGETLLPETVAKKAEARLAERRLEEVTTPLKSVL